MSNFANAFLKFFKADKSNPSLDLFELSDDNGYVFCNNYYIPEEVLSIILSYVPPKDLVSTCRRVCKYWRNVVDSQVWKIILARNDVPVQKIKPLPWFACYWIVLKSPFGRNLIRNNCGQDNLEHWDILSSGGDGWKIEKPPEGSEEFPKDLVGEDVLEQNSCFATSFYSCTKKQTIELKKEGAVSQLMDIIQPHIHVVDWYCGRFDSGAVYELKIKLLDEKYETVEEFQVRKRVGLGDGSSWQKASHVFQGYGPGVKFIEFYHGGMDSQFWKGHYGSKMTGASVILSFP